MIHSQHSQSRIPFCVHDVGQFSCSCEVKHTRSRAERAVELLHARESARVDVDKVTKQVDVCVGGFLTDGSVHIFILKYISLMLLCKMYFTV